MLSKVEADAVMDQLDVDSKAKSFLIHESKSLFSILFPSPLFCFWFFFEGTGFGPRMNQ